MVTANSSQACAGGFTCTVILPVAALATPGSGKYREAMWSTRKATHLTVDVSAGAVVVQPPVSAQVAASKSGASVQSAPSPVW